MIEYKGYIGIFEFDEEKKLFRGRVSDINDLVTFQGKSINGVKEAFEDAVNEYISWCKQYRNEPKRLHSLLKEKGNGGGG